MRDDNPIKCDWNISKIISLVFHCISYQLIIQILKLKEVIVLHLRLWEISDALQDDKD